MAHPKGGYRLPDGSRIPGTTTITGRFKDSGALLFWAFEQGKAAERGEISSLYDKRDAAGETGTGTHHLVWRHVHGLGPLDLDKLEVLEMGPDGRIELDDDKRQQMQSGFDAYLMWEKMTKLKITFQEIQLVSEEFRFGGCPDAVGLIEGKPCLIDWKTSKGVYSDFLCQIAAYGHLLECGLRMDKDYQPLGIKVQGFHLCKFSKDYGDFSHHYYPELDIAWEQFKLFRQAYENDKVLKRRAS